MRGLNDFYFQMPYPICRTNGELLEQLRNYSPEGAEEAARQFMLRFGGVDKGDASKQVVERIRKEINSGTSTN